MRWEQQVTNKEISECTNINNIMDKVKKRRWKWPGHVFTSAEVVFQVILKWTSPGKRGRPLGTWRRTVEEEMKLAGGKTWNELSRTVLAGGNMLAPYAPVEAEE